MNLILKTLLMFCFIHFEPVVGETGNGSLMYEMVKNCRRSKVSDNYPQIVCLRNVFTCSKAVFSIFPEEKNEVENFFLSLYTDCASSDQNLELNVAKACLTGNFQPENCGNDSIITEIMDQLALKMVKMQNDSEAKHFLSPRNKSSPENENSDFITYKNDSLDHQALDYNLEDIKATSSNNSKPESLQYEGCSVGEEVSKIRNRHLPRSLLQLYAKALMSVFNTGYANEDPPDINVFQSTLHEVLEECQLKKLQCCVAEKIKQYKNRQQIDINFISVSKRAIENAMANATEELSKQCQFQIKNFRNNLANLCSRNLKMNYKTHIMNASNGS